VVAYSRPVHPSVLLFKRLRMPATSRLQGIMALSQHNRNACSIAPTRSRLYY